MDNQGNNPRYISKFIQSVYIADGLEEDAEELIKRCLQSDVLSYHVFCNIWKDMNFSAMYQGRQSFYELAEVSEEAILIAKRYMTRVCENFEESVAGLFLVYAILRLQPFRRFAPLRLTPEDVEATIYLEQTARTHNRYDVLYILGSLLIEGPCEFHVSARDYGLESNIRKNFDASSSVNKIGVRPRGVFNHRNEELDLLRELSSLGKKYTNYKNKISVIGNKNMVTDMNYYKESIITDLSSSLRNLINGDVDLQPAGKKPEEPTTPAVLTSRQLIKQRAMMNAVDNLGHLTGLQERNNKHSPKKLKEKSPKKSDNIRTYSPKKPIPPPQKKKNKLPKKKNVTTFKRKTRKVKYKKVIHSSDDDDSSSDGDDEIVLYDDDSDLDVLTEAETEDDDEEEIETPAKKIIEIETTSRKKTAPMSMDQITTEDVQRKNNENVPKKSIVSKRICDATKLESKGGNIINSIENDKDKFNKDKVTCKRKINPQNNRKNVTIPKKDNIIEQYKPDNQFKRNLNATYASKRKSSNLNAKIIESPEKTQNVKVDIDASTVESIGQTIIDTNSESKKIKTNGYVIPRRCSPRKKIPKN